MIRYIRFNLDFNNMELKSLGEVDALGLALLDAARKLRQPSRLDLESDVEIDLDLISGETEAFKA